MQRVAGVEEMYKVEKYRIKWMITNFAGQPLGVFARGSPFSTDTVIPVTGDVNGKALCPVECFMHRYDPRGREQLSSYYLFTAEKTYLPGSTHRI